jgi:hypothetical protein
MSDNMRIITVQPEKSLSGGVRNREIAMIIPHVVNTSSNHVVRRRISVLKNDLAAHLPSIPANDGS